MSANAAGRIGGLVCLVAVLTFAAPLAAQAAWTQYWYGNAALNSWKLSSVGNWLGGQVVAITYPSMMIVETKQGTNISQGVGVITYTHSERTTREECRWVGGAIDPSIETSLEIECFRKT